jgi:hypothetical protein
MRPPRLAPAVILLAAVACGVLLRVWPSLQEPAPEFLADGAAIARLALDTARLGHVPAVDSLCEAPRGRALRRALAPGLLLSAATFHRLMRGLGSRDAGFDLALFGALCGGLIAVPVFLWARVAWGPGWPASFAALAIVLMPAHLHRTFGYLMRYEPIGSLLVTAHFAAAAAALRSASARVRLVASLGSALAMLAALWAWRVPLMVPLAEAGFVAAFVLWRGAEPAVRDWFGAMAAALTVTLPALAYLRLQRFELTVAWLGVVAVALVTWAPRLEPGRARAAERLLWLAGAIGLAGIAAAVLRTPSPYGATTHFLPARLQQLLGRSVSVDPLTATMLSVEELAPVSPAALLVGAMNLACLGPWFVATPLLAWLAAGRPRPSALQSVRPDHALLFFLALAFGALTVLVYRTKVLLAPVVAVSVAGALAALLTDGAKAAPVRARSRRPRERPRSGGGGTRRFLVGLLVACLAGNAILAVVIARTRESRLPDGERAAMAFLRERTPDGAVVATLWGQGFEVSTYARRATIVDGFLENDVAIRRVLDLAAASLQRSAEPLAHWCRSYGASYLLVPPSTQLLALAMLVNDPLVPKLRAGLPLTPAEADRALVRMMVYGRDEPPFAKEFESDLWRVYRVRAPADDSLAAKP